jgi:predicted nuclease of predicted toxin-antitoxin system
MAGRLLFDKNLSPRLVSVTADAFPGSIHIRDAGLKGATDQEVWAFAQQRGYTIVTKDDDFRSLSLLRGAPPKVLWLIVGNTSTHTISKILLSNRDVIAAFINEPITSLLTLHKG